MSPKTARTRRAYWFVLGATILLAAGLRLGALDAKSLWGDEINTSVLFVRMPVTYIVTHMHPNNHIFFSLMAHLFTVGGANDFLLRVAAAMLGIAAVPALYQLGRVIFSPTVGLVSATLLALSPYHLWFSLEARGYTGAVFFSVLSLLFLVQAIRQGRSRHYAGFILTTALALYTHLFSILLLGSELCILAGDLLSKMALGRRSGGDNFRLLRPWLISLGILALLLAFLYAPLWLAFLSLIDKAYGGSYVSQARYTTDWTFDVASLVGLLRRFGGSLFREWHLVTTVSLACFCLGIVTSLVRRRKAALALVGHLTIPFLLVAGLMKWWSGFYAYSRFFIILLPIYLLLVAYGLVSIGRLAVAGMARWTHVRVSSMVPTGILVLVLLGVPSVPALRQAYVVERQDWRGVGDYLTANTKAGDLVIQIWLMQPNSLGWYFQPDARGVEVFRADALRSRVPRIGSGRQVWWVFVHQGQAERLNRELGGGYEVATFTWLAVLHKKGGLEGPEQVLDAAVTLIDLQGEFSPSERSAYQTLADDVLGNAGFDQAQYYADRGKLQLAEGKWDDAALSFERAARCWPDWGLAHTKLGSAYRNLGRLEEAEASYRRSIEVEPEYVGAYVNLGALYEEQGRGQEAVELLQTAVDISPDSAWAHAALGDAYLRLGDSEEAQAHLARAVELEPDSVAWLLALANGYREVGRHSEAIVAYRQVLELDPGNRQAAQALERLEP